MRLYLAGPVTGIPDHNRPAFEHAQERLEAAGFEIVTPVTIEDEIGHGHSWETYMRAALQRMLAAEGVALLPGWIESRGARIEQRLARDLGMPVDVAVAWFLRGPL